MDTQNTAELHVIFGAGPLGKGTALELVKLGKRVRMINRSGKVDGVPAEVECVSSDAYDAARNVELTRGATTVYQCAQPKYHEWQEKFPPLQTAILDAAMANNAKLVVAENVYMYGDTHGAPMDETTPNRAATKKGLVRKALTEQIADAVQQGKVRAARVRGSDFFGPDDPIYADLFFKPALQAKTVNMLGRLDVPHSWTYAPDFGKALALAGTRDEAMGQIWHVPSDTAVTQQALLDLMSANAGHPVKGMAAKKWMLRALGLVQPAVGEMVEMYYEFEQPFVLNSDKFTRMFGMQPTPLAVAVRETMAANRARMGGEEKSAQSLAAA